MPESLAQNIPDFTPVNLISGFLGSGKTTLLKRMLASPALADTAVLINEFGEVGLDHELIGRVDDNTVLLQSGCLCCTIRGELADAIKSLHSRRARGEIPIYRRLMIESTGLADPLPILTTITAEPALRHHYRLGLVVTTVDAVNGMGHLDRQPESLKQAAVADRLVVTKTDIADSAVTTHLVARLRHLNPAAPVRFATDKDLDPEELIGRDLFDIAAKSREVARWFEEEAGSGIDDDDHHPHDHGHPHVHDPNRHGDDIRAFSFVFDKPIDWTAFGLWLSALLNRHGEAILRVKGILSIAGESAPVAVNGVQQLVHAPTHLAGWPTDDRRTRIVFICKGLDEELIRRSFSAFVLKQQGNHISDLQYRRALPP
ncbi:MAG: GTP-binding protein [Hyphomicrobiales bacterium]|nr:GTP-binding protein [Hyphomicrobiales bacterium]MBV9910589.1 GTP-binding protein [Hyphomicrobiales bacterium]